MMKQVCGPVMTRILQQIAVKGNPFRRDKTQSGAKMNLRRMVIHCAECGRRMYLMGSRIPSNPNPRIYCRGCY